MERSQQTADFESDNEKSTAIFGVALSELEAASEQDEKQRAIASRVLSRMLGNLDCSRTDNAAAIQMVFRDYHFISGDQLISVANAASMCISRLKTAWPDKHPEITEKEHSLQVKGLGREQLQSVWALKVLYDNSPSCPIKANVRDHILSLFTNKEAESIFPP